MSDTPALFEGRNIRKVWFEDEWWFAVVDVVEALTESSNPQVYWRRLKQRLREEGDDVTEQLRAFKLLTRDDKFRYVDCGTLHNIIHFV